MIDGGIYNDVFFMYGKRSSRSFLGVHAWDMEEKEHLVFVKHGIVSANGDLSMLPYGEGMHQKAK
jgi:hypothetical protein